MIMNMLPPHIQLTENASAILRKKLAEMAPDRIAFLVDENTKKLCLPSIDIDQDFHLIEIKSGEQNKTLNTCEFIWEHLTQYNFTRNSLLINLGGGVIGDMGGFTAATYKRGIRFINIPTTLLSQVDASIGGKLGIDFSGLKNHIGIFRDPDTIIIDQSFINTLPQEQVLSGFAEIIKHALIRDNTYWDQLQLLNPFSIKDWNSLVYTSIQIKNDVVQNDPYEKGLRKILNFGHTLGHAMETWKLNHQNIITHGEAIAVGMIMETYLAFSCKLISENELQSVSGYIKKNYPYHSIPDVNDLIELMKHDKKNDGDKVNFSLIKTIGECDYNVAVDTFRIKDAVDYYESLYE